MLKRKRVELNLRRPGWQKCGSIWVQGCIEYGGKFITAQELEVLLGKTIVDDRISLSFVKALVGELKGFFSIVWLLPHQTLLIADFVRTYPLFISVLSDTFVISDSMSPPSQSAEVDVGNLYEFAITGFVTGPGTTFKSVFQVQAGEAVLLCHDSGEIQRILHSTWNPIHPKRVDGAHDVDGKEVIKIIDDSLSLVTDRLISYLNGRTAVIPLSGGWDSRTILLHLKRKGYPRILAFSYGKQGNAESVVSAEVARQLGVEWVFVPYHVSNWRAWAETSEYWEYLWYAHGGVSASHIQDALAIREMLLRGVLVPEDAVVIPGHSGDFVAGSHLRPEYGYIQSIKGLRDAIFKKHYVLIPGQAVSAFVPAFSKYGKGEEMHNQLYEKVLKQIKLYYSETPFSDPYAFLEFWNWRERQAKFIVNSVRVYEFFGLDFWLPLWDVDFVRLWQNVPLEWRMDRKLFSKYLIWLQEKAGLNLPVVPMRNNVKRMAQRMGLMPILRKMRDYIARVSVQGGYSSHPLQWYGIWDEAAFNTLVSRTKGQMNINTLVVLDIIRRFYPWS